MPIRPVRASAASGDPYECDLYNYSSVFRSLEFDIEFGMISETNLPIITSAPSNIPSGSPFVCLFGRPWERDLSSVLPIFSSVKARLLSFADTPARPEEFDATQFLVCETIGHAMRCEACFETDPVKRQQLFDEAYRIYEGVLFATCHSSMIEMIKTVRSGNLQKAVLFQPAPDMVGLFPDRCRILSHSFAGMALCSLMTEGCPVKFVSLVSASLCYEKFRPMELACTLRLLPFLMYENKFTVPSGCSSSEEASTKAVLNTLIMKSAQKFGMCISVTETVLLPVMLMAGRRDLFDAELGFIEPEKRAEKERFAMAIHQRTIDRQSAPAPLNSIRTHIVDGRILDRKCAGCGVWDRTGKSHSRCSRCMLVYYCGRGCQMAHWGEHKKECGK